MISRGEVVIENGKLQAARGRGQFIERGTSDAAVPASRQIPEMAQLDAWGTPFIP